MSQSTETTPKFERLEVQKPVPDSKNTKEHETKEKSIVKTLSLEVDELSRAITQHDTSLARAAVSNPLSIYLRVNASNPTNIVNQVRHTIYSSPGDQALFGSSTTTLVAIENIPIFSWENPSEATNKYSESYTVGFTTSTSVEVSASIGLAPSFAGISLWNAEAGYKRITTTETQSLSTKAIEVSVPPHSNVFVYQRRYYFSTEVYFTLDAWNQYSIAGSNGGYHVQKATILSHIDATEYLSNATRLSGTTTSYFDTQARVAWFGDVVRKFENLTQRAKDKLISIGINGSQQA